MKSFNSLVRIAIKHLYLPSVKKSKHFTFILYKGKLYTWGWNSRYQLDDFNKSRFTKHSEVHAIDRLNALLRNRREIIYKDFTLVNIRLNNKNEIRDSFPCNSCRNYVEHLGFKNIYYSSEDGTINKL
jgi:tRNA(Arg) A34 adenosine deaminase TadA